MNENDRLVAIYKVDCLPKNHVDYLRGLRDIKNFHPKVCYGIGACVLHWTNSVRANVWPDTQCVLFEANASCEQFYEGYQYHMGVLSDAPDKTVKYYYNIEHPGGNSYYKENNDTYYPEDVHRLEKTYTLDEVVQSKTFPLPDLVKLDVQGCEKDIISGGLKTINHALFIIVELQHVDYNRDAPKAPETTAWLETLGWKCIAPLFQNNGCDGDYCFINTNHPEYAKYA